MKTRIRQMALSCRVREIAVLTMLGATLLSACTMIPAYHRPQPAIADQYPALATGLTQRNGANAPGAATLPWKAFYRDPALQALIQMALDNNQDLRVAVLNIEAAQAQYRIQRADELPTLSAGISGDEVRYPQDVSPAGYAETTKAYSVNGAVASYEVDLFGRVRSLSQEALQTYFSTIEARKATQISLISATASAWMTYQADANLHSLSQQTLQNQQDGYRIVSATFRDGTGTQLDVAQAETTVRTAEENLARYDRQMHQDADALTLLVGAPIPAQWLQVRDMASIKLDDQLNAGVPSDLLTRRPDIAEAEAKLKAANADIGAARADFFPRIELTASGGTESARLSGLFNAGSAAWSFAPSISVPIFDYGRNKANLRLSNVERDIQVANYQKAIQTAFRDVASALDGVDTYRRQVAAQTLLVKASQRFYDLSMTQYRDGASAYLPVLVSQRSLYEAQQQLIDDQSAHAVNTLSLYAALGGGWNDTAPGRPASEDAATRLVPTHQ